MIPALPTDPKNREQLKHWLERRQELLTLEGKPNTPLTARESLMVQHLMRARAAYSIT